MEIAERIRRAVAEKLYDVETSSEPIRATVSIGVAGYPKDAQDPNALIHQADLAVYRAKLQGRNRVLGASSEPLLLPADRSEPLVAVPEESEGPEPVTATTVVARVPEVLPEQERRHTAHTTTGPRFLQLSKRLGLLVGFVSLFGVAAGMFGLLFGTSTDIIGLLAVVALVGVGEALALELDDGSISVSAVGVLAGAALFGPRAGLALALTTAVVQWSALRPAIHHVLFNIGALSLSSLAAAGVFTLGQGADFGELFTVGAGLAAGGAYFAVNTGLVSLALAFEGRERWWRVWHERFLWLAPHYLVYGFIGGVIAIAYHAAGLYALAVFAVPLLLMRKTQEAYLSHTRRSAEKLRQAAETIHTQNVSLEQANRLLRERSTAAMESLSATVDARDAYTAGHSRRVQQLALAIGRELGLSQVELDLLGHAALFHDIGKLAIPDSILLKPASLTDGEWALMQRHADEGARIIDRLGFLGDAVPSIRHHHERFDGKGYPDGLKGEEIPLGARIIHVADALDSMLTTRIYRAARPLEESLAELRRASGTQFCPRCVSALERILPLASAESGVLPERTLSAVS
jgi:putative nucleotidyltransferase with HDIG domain